MSDKNPYYRIPKSLGEPVEEYSVIEPSLVMKEMIKLRDEMERQIMAAFMPVLPRRQTALRASGNTFEVVEIDDTGKIIEPKPKCPKCGPILLCLEHCAIT